MSAEASSSAAKSDFYGQLSAGELLDNLDVQLKASQALTSARPDGLIQSLDYRRGAQNLDGISPYSSGIHRPRDINVRATIANQQPMAWNHRGNDQFRKLHLLAQQESRYLSSTGENSLQSLSRLTIAMAGLAASAKGARGELTIVGSGHESMTYDDKPFDNLMALITYEEFSDSAAIKTNKPGGQSPLALGLEQLAVNSVRSNSDACLVVSDFLDGTQRTSDGELIGFDWQDPLQGLSDMLGDRLYITRLTTPAQTQLPYVRQASITGKRLPLDAGQLARFNSRYEALGTEKSARIADCLRFLRVVDLSSTDPAPMATASEFIFGSQN